MASKLPLAGTKVLEFAGLAPVPFAGMVLADFGAQVSRIDRCGAPSQDVLARGKRSISLDLKSKQSVDIIKRLCKHSDILIEPFRPGVMEKLSLGPKDLCGINEKLIYVRLNGYGPQGSLSNKAGHDINYLSMSGILSMLGRKGENPFPPINILGDFAGGSMVAVVGILLALFERSSTGNGQVVESSITEGASYISSFIHRSKGMFIWNGERGDNLLDSGAHFYDTYQTKDGRYMAVGAIEPKFYEAFMNGLDMECDFSDQFNHGKWKELKQEIANTFKRKSQQEWIDIYEHLDACVTPVLNFQQAVNHEHNISNHSFMQNANGNYEPTPAPKLSRTPGINVSRGDPKVGEHTVEILKEVGYNSKEVDEFLQNQYVEQYQAKSSL